MITKFKAAIKEFGDTCRRLSEALREKKTEMVRDAAIKRFELAFDLAWKTIKAFLETEGVACASPRNCFKEAYRQGLIEYDDVWMSLVEVRNSTVHTYNEHLADEVYGKLPGALEAFEKLLKALEKKQ